ncbi:hypothetical protein ASF37_11640 [Aeromicrobium sp. Leaf289]|nr:hypothetical protein ASF37_11640 [Aeromicrobium sp. Leaf289]
MSNATAPPPSLTDAHTAPLGLVVMSVRSVSKATDLDQSIIRDAIHRQELPAIYVGGMVRVRARDMHAWLDNQPMVGGPRQTAVKA